MFGGKKLIWCLAIVAGAAAVVPAATNAQDCKLSVHASPQVIYSGQSANVDVLAHFPEPPAPNGAYAFASATFDVFASDPAWTFSSTGAIVGNDVLGASITQLHWPQLGVLADPSNPIVIWHGTFTPQSDAPALVEIEADPSAFSVYPSVLTSSSAPYDAEGGSDVIFVNPIPVGNWLAAPGPGTEIHTNADDVMIDGRIITGENAGTASIGMTRVKVYQCPSDPVARRGRNGMPLIQVSAGVPMHDAPVEEVSFNYGQARIVYQHSSARVEFDQPPTSFTATVQIEGKHEGNSSTRNTGHLVVGLDNVDWAAQRSQIGSMSISFTGLESGGYSLQADASEANGFPVFAFEGYIGGVRVAAGDLGGEAQVPGFVVGAVPQVMRASVGPRSAQADASGANLGKLFVGVDQGVYAHHRDEPLKAIERGAWTLLYDQPVVATFSGPDGNALTVTLDRIELSGGLGAGKAAVRDLSVGCHVFRADGVQQMKITPNV